MKNDFYFSKYIRQFFEDYLICQKNLSGSTIHSYRDTFKLFIKFSSQKIKNASIYWQMKDITKPLIYDFLDNLEKQRSNSIQTRNHRLSIMRKFFEFVALEEPLLADHCLELAKIPSKRGAILPVMQYLEKKELMALFEAINTKTLLGRRDYALLLFMYNTGARVQETANVRYSWVNFHEPYRVEIIGKGNKRRICPLWKNTAEVLERLISEFHHPVLLDSPFFVNRLGQPIGRFGIANAITKYKQLAEINEPSLRHKSITPHTIRHTTAMHLLKSGVEINVIRSWLGHVSLKTTNRYVEIDLEMKTKALSSCEPENNQFAEPLWEKNPDILVWLDSL